MILSLSRPAIYDQTTDKTLSSREFIIAIDLSRSMSATDLKPSRFEAAKRKINEILSDYPNDLFWLFGFTSNPLILSPATTDHRLLKIALESIEPKNILTKSTSIRSLLQKVSKLPADEKNLIILSDGGDERGIGELLKIAKKNNIKIVSVSMATKRGSTLKDEFGKTVERADRSILITKANPLFKTLALKSGGEFFNYDQRVNLDNIGSKLNSKKSLTSAKELFIFPLLLSLLLLFINYVRLPKVFPFLLLLNLDANSDMLDWLHIKQASTHYDKKEYLKAAQEFEKVRQNSIKRELNIAHCYYKASKLDQAKHILLQLRTKDKKLKQKILHLLGNIEAKEKNYQKAKFYYRLALSLGKDRDILYNLKKIAFKTDEKKLDFNKKGSEKIRDLTASTKEERAKKSMEQRDKNRSKRGLTRPLGFRAYETINRGYIDEKNPW
jgi:Ca-activated chloride channel family protein